MKVEFDIQERPKDMGIKGESSTEIYNFKVILIHPSKNLKPSKHDLNISNKLNKMLKCFNITLADHIIVTENDYHSMAHNKEIDYDFNTKELSFIDNTF